MKKHFWYWICSVESALWIRAALFSITLLFTIALTLLAHTLGSRLTFGNIWRPKGKRYFCSALLLVTAHCSRVASWVVSPSGHAQRAVCPLLSFPVASTALVKLPVSQTLLPSMGGWSTAPAGGSFPCLSLQQGRRASPDRGSAQDDLRGCSLSNCSEPLPWHCNVPALWDCLLYLCLGLRGTEVRKGESEEWHGVSSGLCGLGRGCCWDMEEVMLEWTRSWGPNRPFLSYSWFSL